MKRFMISGLTQPPCGVPRSRRLSSPASLIDGAFSHRSTYSSAHLQSVCFLNAFMIRPWSSPSNAPLTSNSSTQSNLQHRSLVHPHRFVRGHQVPVNIFDLRDGGDNLLAKHDVPVLASVAGDPDPAQVGIESEALQQ